ncbi:MAG: extracellular solute-binding protein [Chloroflexota bacterium]|nr:extracellular solute-binding protein [Chloroflexota bacterium]
MIGRRVRGAGAVAAIGMIAAVACGGGGQQGGGVTLTLWTYPQGDDEASLKAYIERFQAENAGISLRYTVYPEEDYQTKINTALQAGRPPDIAIIESRDWMKAGRVVELTDYYEEWGVSVDEFNPGGLARAAVEADPSQGVYGVGDGLFGNVLAYNKALFDAASVDYPPADRSLTYEEYADLCRQVGQPDANPANAIFGCSMPDFSFGFYPIYGDDGHTAVGFMDSDELAEAFEIGAALINEGYAPSSSLLETQGESDLFASGQIAITWTDFSQVPTYQANDIDFGLAPFFVVEGQDDFVDTWTSAWGTFVQSAHQADALKFLEFLATDGQRIRVETSADPPLSTKVAEEIDYGNDDPIKQQYLEVLQNARPLVFVPPGEEEWDPGEVLRLLTVEGQAEADPILDEMAQRAQERLEEVWAEWEELGAGD